jgi:hypothetical protein
MSENTVDNSVMPGKYGGELKVGNPGNAGGTGRPKSEVRAACASAFDARIPKLQAIADNVDGTYSSSDVLKALDMLGKYGGLQQVDQTSGDTPLKQAPAVTIGADVPLADVLNAIEKLKGE